MQTVALVGCAHIHTPGFVNRLKARSDVRVKYTWDPVPAKAQKNAEALGATAVDSARPIWRDKEVSAVVICSETNRHRELVRAACASGKHLFVEKPLGMGATDAYAMATAIEKAGVLFQTGYFMRGMPVHQFLRSQVTAGAFGKITRIRRAEAIGHVRHVPDPVLGVQPHRHIGRVREVRRRIVAHRHRGRVIGVRRHLDDRQIRAAGHLRPRHPQAERRGHDARQ